MTDKRTFLLSFLLLLGCSETPIEEQDDAAAAEIEKQIEGDAKSLEEAAAEAVNVLETEIEDDLVSAGYGIDIAQEEETDPAE